MPKIEQTIVSKHQLLSNFLGLKEWLIQYWHFLEEMPLHEFASEAEVIKHLRYQHQSLLNTKIKLHTLEMAGAVLAFALDRINPKQIVFQIHVAEHPKETLNLPPSAHEVEASLQKIVEQVLYLSRHLVAGEEKLSPLLKAIGSFFKAIIHQDSAAMEIELSHIGLLSATKETHVLIHEVGKITREIYDSLQHFSNTLEVDTAQIQNATQEMPDAVEKINSVIDRLETAANDNLEFLETLMEQSESHVAELESLLTCLTTLDEMLTDFGEKHEELIAGLQPMKDLLGNEIIGKVESLLSNFQKNEELFLSIMTNQGFQDLTGQTLKKVIDFIEHLELRLLELIQKFSPESQDAPKKSTGVMTRLDHGVLQEEIKLDGPDKSEEEKSKQNDVDSLLADLGF